MSLERVIQWNLQGMGSAKEDLVKLINVYKPAAIAVQETHYGADFMSKIKGYAGICKQGHFNQRFHGGVALYIHNSCHYREITITTNYQIVAAQINIAPRKTITVASVYIPGRVEIREEEIRKIIEELPKPVIIAGDFNAHNKDWGNRCTDLRGRALAEVATTLGINIINEGQPTHESGTAIDLTIVSPELTPDLQWQAIQNPLSSDHFPIIITITTDSFEEPEVWNFKKARWKDFKRDGAWQEFQGIDLDNPSLAIKEVYRRFEEMAERHIPKNRCRRFYPKIWWTNECKEVWRAREKSYRKYKATGNISDKIEWKKNRAIATKTFREAKQESWRDYVSTLNVGTMSGEVWKTINKIRGRNTREKLILRSGSVYYTEREEIAEKLAETFAKVSSEENYNPTFLRYKIAAEQTSLNFKSTNTEPYNNPFTMQELKDAINTNKDTAPGPDGIHNRMLKNIPENSLIQLLNIFNRLYDTGFIPKEWKQATIVPIAKPDKDRQDPTNYRPISLTSCLCKTFEKIINRRLMEYLEVNKLLTANQCGFRKYHSTADHLVRLDTYVRKGYAEDKYVTAVFFDLEKAYDSTWRYGILKDVHEMGIRGNLARYIEGFLTDREFKVRVGSTYSSVKKQVVGVPQGSTLSVTLFAIKINSVAAVIPNDIFSSLFVDDILIAGAHHQHDQLETKLQNAVNAIIEWADGNGFKFSKRKTKVMQFYKKTAPIRQTNIQIRNRNIPLTSTVKFLGLNWDPKLSWKDHIGRLRARCARDLNLLRSLTAVKWGADQETLMRLYRTIIRPKIDYGCMVYGAAMETELKQVEAIANEAFRISSGAFKTTPIANLQVLVNEPPLELRRQDLLLRYFYKLKCHLQNPAYSSVINTNLEVFFNSRNYAKFPIIMRLRKAIELYNIPTQPVLPYITQNQYSWTMTRPEFESELAVARKDSTPAEALKAIALENMHRYENSRQIYTDGSKSEKGVGAAAVAGNKVIKSTLPPVASILTAELHAINLALTIIEESDSSQYVIFTDSLSAVNGLGRYSMSNHLMERLLNRMHSLSESGKAMRISWIPSHVGIKGNERADEMAKRAAV